MAGKEAKTGHMNDADLCSYLCDVEEEYGVRIRAALVPFATARGRSTHAVVVTAYYPHGKRIVDLEPEQVLFPGETSRTFAGAAFYAATKLVQEVDAWSVRKQREEEQWEPGQLTPLERYIAGAS